jgi:hypothetical protein
VVTASSNEMSAGLRGLTVSGDHTRQALVSLEPLTASLLKVVDYGRQPTIEEKAVASLKAFLRVGPAPTFQQVRGRAARRRRRAMTVPPLCHATGHVFL